MARASWWAQVSLEKGAHYIPDKKDMALALSNRIFLTPLTHTQSHVPNVELSREPLASWFKRGFHE
jgi:hypothetical protein